MRYCGLKNPAFWFVLRFLVHNSRARFLETCCFCKKYKKTLALCAVVFLWITLLPKISILTLGTFKLSKPSPSEFMSFFLLYDVKLHGEKIEKTDDPEILHCRQMRKRTKPNCQDTPAKVGVQLIFATHSWYRLSVAVWWYFVVRLWVKLFVSRPDASFFWLVW